MTLTDQSLLVTNFEKFDVYDVNRISSALITQENLQPDEANQIALSVEEKLHRLNLTKASTSLIRELVDIELSARGYKRCSVILPKDDMKRLLLEPSKENSNIATFNPETVAFNTSELAIKRFMLDYFPDEISDAHISGRIHIHDLGFPRVYCSVHSPAFISKYGLRLPGLATVSAPPKHLDSLIGQTITFLSFMQAYYAGAMGLAFVNVLWAPYAKGLSRKELKQQLQMFYFSLGQSAFSRGAQTLFTDVNISADIPEWLAKQPTILGGTYGDYRQEALLISELLCELAAEGDGSGAPMQFPKIDFHITKETFESLDSRRVLEKAAEAASINGSIYFIFDYTSTTLAACCRLRTDIKDHIALKDISRLRFCGFQNVTINLPQIGYEVGVFDFDKIKKEIRYSMELALKTHFAKKSFVETLMKPGSCLEGLTVNFDGEPYVDTDKCTYLFGLLGLDSFIKTTTGEHLHESEDALEKGIMTVGYMRSLCNEFSQKYGLKFVLEEAPAESSLPFDEQILVYDGQYSFYKIGEFVEKYLKDGQMESDVSDQNILIPSFNKVTKQIELKRALSVVKHFPKHIYTINLCGGKHVKTTGDHSIFVMNKSLEIVEKKTSELRPGDFIITAKRLPVLGNLYLYCSNYLPKNGSYVSLYNHIDFLKKNEEELKSIYTSKYKTPWKDIKGQLKKQNIFRLDLISHLISNEDIEYIKLSRANKIKNKLLLDEDLGYLLGFILAEGSEKSISNTNPKYIEKIENIITEKFGDGLFFKQIRKDTRKQQYKTVYSLMLNKTLVTLFKRFKITERQLVRDIDTSLLISEDVCRGIIRGYIDGDGSITYSKQKGDYNIRFYTISSLLKDKLTLILKLLGIDYKLRIDRKSKVRENWHDCFVISVFGRENIAKLIDIGINIDNKGRADSIPHIATIIKKIINTYTYSYWRNILGYNIHNDSIWVDARQGYINRHKATKLLYKFRTIPIIYQQFGAIIEKMINLLECDLMFEKVESIEKSKDVEPVYDISVEGNENFIGGEGFICLHNTARRLALIDRKRYGDKAEVLGEGDSIYYPNSIHLIPNAPVSLIERIQKQSLFHPLIEGGAIIHAFVGEELPPPSSIINLVKKIYDRGQCAQIVFSPEFTFCYKCYTSSLGFHEQCKFCGSSDVDCITRIVGYYSRVSRWNKSKKEELKHRREAQEDYRLK